MSNDESKMVPPSLSDDRRPAPETNYLIKRYEELGRPGLTAWGQIAENHWRKNLPEVMLEERWRPKRSQSAIGRATLDAY